jgi:glycosyltransferase involved in cell wall biosynthesis
MINWRTSGELPSFAPVADGSVRPSWSVMIPTYNCAAYLREALKSVLAQAPSLATMQIEVVDDCSTRDDPETVVREVGRGRVGFFRQPQNIGATANFNTCIRRAQGRLVHILHGDDLVEPGFYGQVAALSTQYPSVALLATRSYMVDGLGKVLTRSDRAPSLEQPSRDARCLLYSNPLRTPGVVVRRDFYEAFGGFHLGLSHTADWEMWARAVACGGGVMLNDALARYRESGTNDTSRLQRTGENLRDYLRFADVMARRHEDFDVNRFRLGVRLAALTQRTRFRKLGDHEAAEANDRLFKELADVPVPTIWRLKERVASIPVLGPIAVLLKERWIKATR